MTGLTCHTDDHEAKNQSDFQQTHLKSSTLEVAFYNRHLPAWVLLPHWLVHLEVLIKGFGNLQYGINHKIINHKTNIFNKFKKLK